MRTLVALSLLAACARTVPAQPPAPAPQPVWIDTDPAVGVPDRDVDDGVALLQALRSPELVVRGVSTVFGNAPLDPADGITRTLLADWAPHLPVHRGASEAGTSATAASEAIIDALEAEPLTLLVLGPATNVATALRARPDLVERVTEVVAVAGRVPGHRFTTGTTNTRAHRDFNLEQDPEAFRILLDLGVPLTLAPFALSEQVWLREPELERMADSRLAASLATPARGWLDLWQRVFQVDGFNPFDTLAVGVLVRPDLIGCTPARFAVELGPDDVTEAAMQGTEVPIKAYLHARTAPDAGGTPGRWCTEVQAEAFVADLLTRLTAP